MVRLAAAAAGSALVCAPLHPSRAAALAAEEWAPVLHERVHGSCAPAAPAVTKERSAVTTARSSWSPPAMNASRSRPKV